MRNLRKKNNYYSEESFHDEWAISISLDDIDVVGQFEGETSPEYKEAISLIGTIKGKEILNVGCGLGEEAVYLAMRGARVTAIDISKQMIEFTKKLAKRYDVENNIICYQMPLERLTLNKSSFDAVFGCNILHHVNIVNALQEVKRVLKPKGIGIFSEPLTYNPVINIYRVMADKVRTDHEHPLSYGDLNDINNIFPTMEHKEFQLFTLSIFVWFFLFERLHPNKVRYWKKIISEAEKYKYPFQILYTIDRFMLNFFPFLRRYCWVTVIKVQK